jgi:hypothetical protein
LWLRRFREECVARDKEARDGGAKAGANQPAARGDKKALKRCFDVGLTEQRQIKQIAITGVVIHLIGDDAFARFLREQPRNFRKQVSFGWELGIVYPFDTEEYFRQHSPQSAKILFPE